MRSLRDGETTREEVLLRLGGPDICFESGRVLLYSWGEVVALSASMLRTVSPVVAGNILLMEFDAEGRLLRHASRRETHWAALSPLSPEWTRAWFGENKELWATYALKEMLDSPLSAWVPASTVDARGLVANVDLMPELWVALGPRAEGNGKVAVAVDAFLDARATPYRGTLSGRNWGKRGKIVAIHNRRPIGELVRAWVIRQLERHGYTVSEGGVAVTLKGTVHEFKAEGELVSLNLALEVQRHEAAPAFRGRYDLQSKSWYSPSLPLEQSVHAVFEKLRQRLAEDHRLWAALRDSGVR